MVDSVSGNRNAALLQSLQSTRSTAASSAAETSAVSTPQYPVAPVQAVPSATAFDTVEISEEGRAYLASQESGKATAADTIDFSARSSNKALLAELNRADSTGMSLIQRAVASVRAGVSAADLLPSSASVSKSNTSALSALNTNDLLSAHTQSRQTMTLLRTAGASALGIYKDAAGTEESAAEGAGSTPAVDAAEAASSAEKETASQAAVSVTPAIQ